MNIEYYAFALFISALICIIAIILKMLFANVKRQRRMLDEKESKLLQLYRSVESIMEDFNDQISTAMDDIKEYESRAAAHMASIQRQPEPEHPTAPPTPAHTTPARPMPSRQSPPARPVYPEAAAAPPMPVRQSGSMTVDSSRIRAASEVLERAERMIKSSPGKSAERARTAGNTGVAKNAGAPPSRNASSAYAGADGSVIQRLFDDSPGEASPDSEIPQAKNTKRESILELAKDGMTHAQIARELNITQNEVKLVIDMAAV